MVESCNRYHRKWPFKADIMNLGTVHDNPKQVVCSEDVVTEVEISILDVVVVC